MFRTEGVFLHRDTALYPFVILANSPPPPFCASLFSQFDTIADVATDKLFTQIPSSYNGKIHKIFHKEEDQCQVGELLLEFDIDEGDVSNTTQNQGHAA